MLIPVRLKLIKPGSKRNHRLRPKLEIPEPGVRQGALIGNDASLQQHLEVPAHRRSRHPDGRGQLTGPSRCGAEQLDHFAPNGIRERAEDGSHLRIPVTFIIHRVNS